MHDLEPKPIPSEIHFIWLGSPLPEKYLRTLLQLLPVARRSGFKLNLWVDQPSNYYQSVDRYMSDLDLSTQNSFLQIKNLSELKSEMYRNDFFSQKNDQTLISKDGKSGAFTRGQDRWHDFWSCVDREMIGINNFAAASDLLRYAILYLKGGYYFDTDTQFLFTKDSKLVAESLPLGFKANIDCCFSVINPSDTISCNYETKVRFKEVSAGSNNDIIAVLPQHLIMEKALVSIIQAYNRRDALTLCQNRTAMDGKRYPESQNHPNNARISGTIALSGPGLLADAIEGVYREKKSWKYGELKSMCGLHSCVFANMGIKVVFTDRTWIKAQAEESYDDNTLCKLSRQHFFARQANSITGLADENLPEKKITNSIRC